jgi:hypothetical protein
MVQAPAGSIGKLRVGKVFGDTNAAFGQAFGTIWLVALIFIAPVALLFLIAGLLGSGIAFVFLLLGSLGLVVAQLWITAASIRVVQDVRDDGKVDGTVGEIIGSVASRLLPLFGLAIVLYFLISIGLFFLVIPGIILTILWSVAVQALIIEEAGVFGSMSRSQQLTSGNMWRVFSVYLVVYAAYAVFVLIFFLLSQLTPILGALFVIAFFLVAFPYLAILATMLYYDLREAHGDQGGALPVAPGAVIPAAPGATAPAVGSGSADTEVAESLSTPPPPPPA